MHGLGHILISLVKRILISSVKVIITIIYIFKCYQKVFMFYLISVLAVIAEAVVKIDQTNETFYSTGNKATNVILFME